MSIREAEMPIAEGRTVLTGRVRRTARSKTTSGPTGLVWLLLALTGCGHDWTAADGGDTSVPGETGDGPDAELGADADAETTAEIAADADADTEPDMLPDAGPDADADSGADGEAGACDEAACWSWCVDTGYRGGRCVEDECWCADAPDADADGFDSLDAVVSRNTGEPCEADADCLGPDARCITEMDLGYMGSVDFPNGYCSSDCDPDDSCGPGALCLDLGMLGGPVTCAVACDVDGPEVCRVEEGYVCTTFMYFFDTVCAPPMSFWG